MREYGILQVANERFEYSFQRGSNIVCFRDQNGIVSSVRVNEHTMQALMRHHLGLLSTRRKVEKVNWIKEGF